MITQWIKLLRVHQYVKNVFIFLPLFFALKIQQYDLLAQAGVAFVLFSLLASAVYIMNDLKDVRQDREHPVKKLRPIASGAISTRSAVGVFVLLLLTSLLSWWHML
jgi:4-hydroxybenzoate polyprenyltransferase